MLANALTKHDANEAIWNLLTYGWWQIYGQVRIRHTNRVVDFEEADLHDMGKAKATRDGYKPSAELGEELYSKVHAVGAMPSHSDESYEPACYAASILMLLSVRVRQELAQRRVAHVKRSAA